MAISIEKRIRAVDTDPWGAWIAVVEAGPYTDTPLVEYRVDDGKTEISIQDVTRNLTISTEDDTFIATGEGYLDDLMESVNTQLKVQHDNGRITGPAYAQVYMSLFQAAMAQSLSFALNKRQKEIEADRGEIMVAVEEATKQNNIDISGYKKDTERVNSEIAEGTKADKIALAAQQLAKLLADTEYVNEQETQLINSVNFNNQIKAIDALGDTYGTFGAGGLTVSSDMWATYFGLINDLTGTAAPTSTTVSKVS